MGLRKKIITQKNWKLKMQITLLIPLIFVIVYIFAQTGAIDLSSITGFATLGAKGNNQNNNDKSPAVLSDAILPENDYSIFAQDSFDKDKDKKKDDKDKDSDESNQDDNSDENDDAQGQEPPALGGGGSGGKKNDKPPVVTPPTDDDDDNNPEQYHGSTGAIPDFPANFWGILTINYNVASAGETIIATVNNTEYQTTTLTGGYYTITFPETGELIDFSYNGTLIGSSSVISGAVKELNLTFNV
ncbi:MAG: hypothetical protein K0B07_03305 [DPANN group archaeon]|nr:hypothetical protein [DPANN group archaeon]